ncbi:ATP-binding protein [Lacrimispora sp.]|uniref:ATP-binding protein n=1 Tax=Lacrimispora sp. TaxID=2719234 RepID=UPI00345F24D9
MKKFWEKRKKQILTVIMSGIIIFLTFAMQNTYLSYRRMIVEQQQQHLMLITRAVSQNLELNISEQLRQISILIQTPGFLDAMEEHYRTGETEKIKEYIFSYMLSDQSGGPARMYLLYPSGEPIFHYNQYPFLEKFDESLLQLENSALESTTGIGVVFPISEHHYGLSLINSVYSGGRYLGAVISVIDLEDLYQKYVLPLNVGRMGYITVKNQQETIIMHPDEKMLGFNYKRDIREFEELNQYESLRRMLGDQYGREEGMAIYDSYGGSSVPAGKEIAAFSRMNLQGTSWYISAAMPYDQAVSVEFDNLRKFGLLFVAVLFIVVVASVIIYSLMKNRQRLELETVYLREINDTLEELYQSREEARHYQKLTTIGTLAGGIAHEFNNLLTPILGYAEFLKEQLGKENEYYQDIDEVHKAGVRAKEIVEQILPFSRKETEITEYASLNLDAVIRDAVKMVSLISPSNITLKVLLDDCEANVYGNATQIHQVLLNLYTNAIHSMEGKGGTLTISTRRLKKDQLPEEYREIAGTEYVEVLVSDTGCGMEEEILRQIFNPFFTTKDAGEGTGLGLAVVQDILISHSGFVRVESRPGEGSHFYIYLPVSPGRAAVQMAVTEAKRESVSDISLLLVDDEERVARYITRRLERRGYHVDAYTDPVKALEALESGSGRWNAAIVDYMMPQMKGTMLAQRIKIRRPDMGIIMVTGLVESDALQMKQAGVLDSILIKPINFNMLIQEIKKAATGKERI